MPPAPLWKWFKNNKIPYGGIILGLTWGLGHIVSKGSVPIGILSAMGGFLFGKCCRGIYNSDSFAADDWRLDYGQPRNYR